MFCVTLQKLKLINTHTQTNYVGGRHGRKGGDGIFALYSELRWTITQIVSTEVDTVQTEGYNSVIVQITEGSAKDTTPPNENIELATGVFIRLL